MTEDPPSSPAPLHDLVLGRLLDSGLAPEVQDVVRALLPATPVGHGRRTGPVYLESVSASGWRGIGPAVTLDVRPGPGLTIVAGRNGSGKSSIAEAAEMALTGDNYRWQDRTQVWKQGWRNLHDHDRPQVSVTLSFGGAEPSGTVRRSWHGTGLADARTLVQRCDMPDAELQEVISPDDLALYRPFLPYSELGAMITASPSVLHDALSQILGLDLLGATDKKAQVLAKSLTDSVNAATALARGVRERLSDVDDPRAAEAVEALAGKAPDLGRMRALLDGSTLADDEDLARLRRLAALEAPDPHTVKMAVARLREAAAAADDARFSTAEDARQLIELLEKALDHRRRHPESADCPVCGSGGRLDREWAARAREQVERLQVEAAAAQRARQDLGAAKRAVHDLVHPVPPHVESDEPDLAPLWHDWTTCRAVTDAHELAERAERASAVLGDACVQVRDDAARRLAAQNARWQTAAGQLGEWLSQAEAAEEAKPRIRHLKAVRAWLKKTTEELRDERLRPIADQSQAVWNLLCERSSVSLGAIALTGTTTSRKVVLDVSVDDIEAPAFGVMSQGELHSLALALFIPRATHENSPFRFLVIDDPVQSMDTEKVDGLAKVLDLYAQQRQVIVFTHDTRLEQAVRRLGIKATIKYVSRQTDSVVQVTDVSDPVSQTLDEARAIALDPNLPSEVADRVLPAMCRVALEAAYLEPARTALRATGLDERAVGERIAAVGPLTELVALTLAPPEARLDRGDVLDSIAADHGTWAKALVLLCNEASHQAPRTPVGDRRDLVRRTERLARAVLAR